VARISGEGDGCKPVAKTGFYVFPTDVSVASISLESTDKTTLADKAGSISRCVVRVSRKDFTSAYSRQTVNLDAVSGFRE
jgi:hypothetical protein